jgi:hypothetical protein
MLKFRLKLRSLPSKIVLSVVFLLLILVFAQVPKIQASKPSSQDKALSFFKDVMQLDMAKYTAALTENSSGDLSYTLKADKYHNLGIFNDFFIESKVDASISFINGNVSACNFFAIDGALLYSQSDPFNRTLSIMQGYQTWTNDSQVQDMVTLLENVGSVKNATQASGNLSLKIFVNNGYTTYTFRNTINGVDYTGVSLTFFSDSVSFSDSRTYQTIGDTSINVSKEQAIKLAENYVGNYSYKTTFENGTTITVTNLNVTGIRSISLGTYVFNPNSDNFSSVNSVLTPYWYVEVNVGNMIPSGLSGVDVEVSANNGTVVSPISRAGGDFGPLLNAILFTPLLLPVYTFVIEVIAVLIAIAVVLWVLIFRNKKTIQNPAGSKEI